MKFGDVFCLLLSILVVVSGVYFFNEFRTHSSRKIAIERLRKTVRAHKAPAARTRFHWQRVGNPQSGVIPKNDRAGDSDFIAARQQPLNKVTGPSQRQGTVLPPLVAPVHHPCCNLLRGGGLTAISDGWKHINFSPRRGLIY